MVDATGSARDSPRLGRRRLLALGGAAIAGIGMAALARRRAGGTGGTSMTAGGAKRSGLYFPPAAGDHWETVTLAGAGWDTDRLEEALAYAGEHNATAVVILHRGRILAERYWQGWGPHTTAAIASCQKSVSAVLFGIARQAGLVRLDDRVTQYLGRGWSRAAPAREEAITLRHLLTMTSGLDDALAYEADPGAVWYYNTPAYYRVKAAIERATGTSMAEYSRRVLFDPIGMRDSSWRGDVLAPPPGQQLHTSVRDMARFGLLVLAGGVWDGVPVLADEAYLAESLRPSQELNHAYGYLWWLNGGASHALPGRGRGGEGPLIPAAPSDLVAALGAGDKKIYVVPSLDLVVARHGGPAGVDRAEAASAFDNQWWERLMKAMTDD